MALSKASMAASCPKTPLLELVLEIQQQILIRSGNRAGRNLGHSGNDPFDILGGHGGDIFPFIGFELIHRPGFVYDIDGLVREIAVIEMSRGKRPPRP